MHLKGLKETGDVFRVPYFFWLYEQVFSLFIITLKAMNEERL